jgi:hypothetical protein
VYLYCTQEYARSTPRGPPEVDVASGYTLLAAKAPTCVMRAATRLVLARSMSGGGRLNDGAKGDRIRQRIREIDAKNAGRILPQHDGGSLSSEHTTARLAGLCDTAAVAELDPRPDGRRCFVLQHADEPSARLAEIWLLPAYPPGRFDAGLAGAAGIGPTLTGAQVHEALPLAAAAPLVAHLLESLRGEATEPVEAAAALPGLSAWVATLTAADLDGQCGVAAADAAMMMALDGNIILDYPSGIKLRTVARPAWEALAAQFAQSAAAEEAALYRDAGASDVGTAYVADTSPKGLRESGGAMCMLAWS